MKKDIICPKCGSKSTIPEFASFADVYDPEAIHDDPRAGKPKSLYNIQNIRRMWLNMDNQSKAMCILVILSVACTVGIIVCNFTPTPVTNGDTTNEETTYYVGQEICSIAGSHRFFYAGVLENKTILVIEHFYWDSASSLYINNIYINKVFRFSDFTYQILEIGDDYITLKKIG